jgi:hypothetical protein
LVKGGSEGLQTDEFEIDIEAMEDSVARRLFVFVEGVMSTAQSLALNDNVNTNESQLREITPTSTADFTDTINNNSNSNQAESSNQQQNVDVGLSALQMVHPVVQNIVVEESAMLTPSLSPASNAVSSLPPITASTSPLIPHQALPPINESVSVPQESLLNKPSQPETLLPPQDGLGSAHPVPEQPSKSEEMTSTDPAPTQSIAAIPPPPPKPMSQADHQACKQILSSLLKHKSSWPFQRPVTDAEAPGYSSLIQNPMDLSTLSSNLSAKSYATVAAFVADVRTMFENCKAYNPAGDVIRVLGEQLQTHFEHKLAVEAPAWMGGESAPTKSVGKRRVSSAVLKEVGSDEEGDEYVGTSKSKVSGKRGGSGLAKRSGKRSEKERKSLPLPVPHAATMSTAVSSSSSRRKSSQPAKSKTEDIAASIDFIQSQIETMQKQKEKKKKRRDSIALEQFMATATTSEYFCILYPLHVRLI